MAKQVNMSYWWQDDTDKAHANVFRTAKTLRDEQQYRYSANKRHARLYGNIELMGLYGRDYATNRSTERLTLNIVQSVIDTVVSQIGTNQPRALVLSKGGDWELQQRAKKLSKFIEGAFYKTKIYEKGECAFTDACIFDAGVLKIYTHNGDICVDRVFPDELIVDDVAALYGEPRELFHERMIARELLIEQYPEHEEAIMSAKQRISPGSTSKTSSQVCVVEAWHLRSSDDADDGRRVLCVDGATLVDEIYNKDDFPFERITWTQRPRGYWGKGLAEILAPIQVEINKSLKKIQLSLHLASPHVFVRPGTVINQQAISNEIWSIIETTEKPDFSPTASVPADLYQHVRDLYQRAFQEAGVSELASQAKKPSGLNSGAALSEYNDIASARFVAVSKRLERFYLACAHKIIDAAKELHEQDEDFAVTAKDKRFIESIKWSEVKMRENSYSLQVFPVSFFPTTPAGKFELIERLMQSQLIGKDEASALLDFPDTEAVVSAQNAPYELIMMHIGQILEKGLYDPPEPQMNLELAMKMCMLHYQKAKTQNAPRERLDLLLQYMEEINNILQTAQQQPLAPPQQPQQQMPPAPSDAMMMPPMPPDAMPPMPPPGVMQ